MYENQTRAACVLTTCKQPKGSAPCLLEYNIYLCCGVQLELFDSHITQAYTT